MQPSKVQAGAGFQLWVQTVIALGAKALMHRHMCSDTPICCSVVVGAVGLESGIAVGLISAGRVNGVISAIGAGCSVYPWRR